MNVTDCLRSDEAADYRDASAIHGVIVADKPPGGTSFDVVRQVRSILGTRRIGHTGTLDPLATGVLPLCVNEATKMASFLMSDNKEYRATMVLGVRTDTLDITGKILEERAFGGIRREDLEAVARQFEGTVSQKVPRYSAVKHRGRPCHWWTRQGVLVDTPVREVAIGLLALESFAPPYATFRVACSKGTYIRTLFDDMGARLGCGAALAELRRIRSGRFDETQTVRLDGLSPGEALRRILERMVPLKDVLAEYVAVPVSSSVARKIRDGYQPERGIFDDGVFSDLAAGSLVRLISEEGDMVAVARALLDAEGMVAAGEREQAFKLVRVFNG